MEEIYINTLSLCMIVKNEEDVIGRCLECVSDIFDEIINAYFKIILRTYNYTAFLNL